MKYHKTPYGYVLYLPNNLGISIQELKGSHKILAYAFDLRNGDRILTPHNGCLPIELNSFEVGLYIQSVASMGAYYQQENQ